ncbi:SusD/RagB family nutrient-binding outer membrane lipoprotein [Spirosoma arcticum]
MKKYALIATLFLGLSSCSDYLDINKNPSTPQVASAQVVLPSMFAQMARGDQFDSRYVGQYVQNWANTGIANLYDRHGYNVGTDQLAEKWRSHYFGNGKNLDLIITDAQATNRPTYAGIAKAIRAWSLQTTTDFHGDMIVTQAFEFGRYSYDFDPQEVAYAETVRIANEALADLAQDDALSPGTLVRSDLVYAGDRAKWTKFVYAVLARNAHHISNKASYSPDKVIEYVDKSLASNADNLLAPMTGSNTDDANFFGPLRNNLGVYRPTVFAMSLVDGTVFGGAVDPRQGLLFNASADGVFRGILPGQGDPNISTSPRFIPTFWGGTTAINSGTGRGLFRDNAPYPIMTYTELQFIKAEAAFLKGDKATAFAAYRKGIEASLDLLNTLEIDVARRITTAQRTAFLASKAVAQTADLLTINDIMQQKYVALYGHGILETWVDMRRYQYSNTVYAGFTLPTTFFPDNSNKPVQRARPRYNSEYLWNSVSIAKVGADKPDYHTVEMWFSQK